MAGVGAEEGHVLGETQDAAVELVVTLLLVGPGEQLAAGDERAGGRVQLVGGEDRSAGSGRHRAGRQASSSSSLSAGAGSAGGSSPSGWAARSRASSRACVSAWSSSRCWTRRLTMCDPTAARVVLAQGKKAEAIDPLTTCPSCAPPNNGGKPVWRFYAPLSLWWGNGYGDRPSEAATVINALLDDLGATPRAGHRTHPAAPCCTHG
ncbi:hypothetical protein ACGH52_38130 [Streptomyces sp. BBFR25]|uniref:hypothetical protein n=1 Tax=Streptomyces sp. BBFR25 TaxID=3372855 RepID=UPI0037DCD903